MSRETRMAARRAAGNTYKYKPNLYYEEGELMYIDEEIKRRSKNVSHKLPLQTWTSIMRKVDNQLEAERQLNVEKGRKKTKEKKESVEN